MKKIVITLVAAFVTVTSVFDYLISGNGIVLLLLLSLGLEVQRRTRLAIEYTNK